MVYNDEMKKKLDGIVQQGKANVATTLKDIQREYGIRQDFMVKPEALDFVVDEKGIRAKVQSKEYGFTQFSRNQVLERAKIPTAFANRLIEVGEHNLLKTNLNILKYRFMDDGVLIRKVDDTVKGFLSPSYRRMDASPIFEAFVNKAMKNGFVPYRGMTTDYRHQISFIRPEISEIAPQEFVVYGLNLTTGDYGSQAMQIEMMVLRIVCTNLAIGYDLLRKIHLGKRFNGGEDNFISLSSKTYELDTKAIASAIGDVVAQSAKHIEIVNKTVKDSASQNVDVKKVLDGMKKKGFGKDILEKIKNTYELPAPVELLPQTPSNWRLSNTLSLIAQSVEDKDTRIDLEKESFAVIAGKQED